MSGQDALIAFVGADFVMVAADMNAGRSIMVFQQEEDKIMHLDTHKLLALGGDPADTVNESEYFQKNMNLYALKYGVSLSTHAAANYMRGEKSANLRKGMKQVDMLLAGWDEAAGPSLCAHPPLAGRTVSPVSPCGHPLGRPYGGRPSSVPLSHPPLVLCLA